MKILSWQATPDPPRVPPAGLPAQERTLDRAKYKDACSQLRAEFFDPCLAQNFGVLLRVLHSHHKVCKGP